MKAEKIISECVKTNNKKRLELNTRKRQNAEDFRKFLDNFSGMRILIISCFESRKLVQHKLIKEAKVDAGLLKLHKRV